MSNNAVRARGFRKAEASLKLEGMDPSGTPLYENVKKRIIEGKVTYDEGRAEIFEYYARLAKQSQA